MTNTTIFNIHDLADNQLFQAYQLFLGLWLFCIIFLTETVDHNTPQNQEIQIV